MVPIRLQRQELSDVDHRADLVHLPGKSLLLHRQGARIRYCRFRRQRRLIDPTFQELTAFINGLTEDEQVDLVALTWLGRGDGELSDWDELRKEAARLHNKRTAAYLLGNPMLGDHLEEGLAIFGISSEGI